ncbi:MAG: galactokinase [Bacteroidetes bacterium]|nr:galactokinase [Bacteroidota bacterium]
MDFPLKELKHDFIALYGGDMTNIQVYFAPGRVNLLGEHTDYNGGLVMPFSLQVGTILLVRKRNDRKIRFNSKNFKVNADVCLITDIARVGNEWVNYPLGVINEFRLKGLEPVGMDLLYMGNIPNGAGLSSSASIEMVTAFAVNDLNNFGVSKLEMVHMSQRAENNFVGMNCGIMDMFAVGMGMDNRVIMLDCDTLDYSLVEIPMEGNVFIISDTKKERKLADSKYNERRSQCEAVVEIVNSHHPIKNLSQLSVAQWDQYKSLISDEVLRKRAKHVITENQRVKDGMAALAHHDLTLFGQKMNASHESLKTDYEVSCYELDVLVEAAQNVNGVLGSRMTGAGFGGCTISLLPEVSVATFKNEVGEIYQQKTGLKPAFYLAVPSEGVRKL